MASEILIRQAEKMYKSMADTTDYAKLATQPFIDVMNEKLAEQKKLTDEMVESSPSGISVDKIPPKFRPMVADWTTEMRDKYIEFGKITSSGISSTDPRYLEARDGMQRIQDAFEKLEKDLVSTGENIQNSLNTRDIKSKYSKLWQQTDHERWSNKSIYESILENGIGEDGSLSYTSEEVDESDFLDDGVTANPNKGNRKSKFVTDFGVFSTSGEGSGAVDALLENQKILARKGEKFDEFSANSMVTTLVGKLGPKGIGDLMYSNPMYIDDFIKKNQKGLAELYGVTGETDEAQYKEIYEALKDEDLTEEFTSHVLGTKENPGMLRSAHDSAFRPYTRPGRRGGGGGRGRGSGDDLDTFGKSWHTTPFGNVSGSSLMGDADRVKKIVAAGGNKEWYQGTSGNKYKLEKGKWYIKEWDKNKRKYAKKYESTLQGVKDDMALSAFDYLLFPGSAAASTAEISKILNKPEEKAATPKGPYKVQIGVFKGSIDPPTLSKMSKLGNITKERVGNSNLYRYYYESETDDYTKAQELQLKAKEQFEDAFISDPRHKK